MKYYSLLIFIASLFVACSESTQPAMRLPEKKPVASYTLATVEKGGLNKSLTLPAQLAAYQEVSIFPRVNGYVKTVLADIGARVSAGQLLMTLEAPELQQAALQARERYARNKANFSLDKEQYLRFLQASATAGAVSPLELSTLKSKMQADSSLANAEKLNWQMQETMMSYLQVKAPFSGVITERNVHPGALVSAAGKDKPMLELKQVDHLRLQVDVPDNMTAGLRDKDTLSFYVDALPGKKMTAKISRQSMNVNPQYRSERVELDVANKDGSLSPGMFASILVFTNGNEHALTVPVNAVVTSTVRKYVLLVSGDKIQKVDVRTGSQAAGKVEVYGALQEGDKVVAPATDEMEEKN